MYLVPIAVIQWIFKQKVLFYAHQWIIIMNQQFKNQYKIN